MNRISRTINWKTSTVFRVHVILVIVTIMLSFSPPVFGGRGRSGWFRRFALPNNTLLTVTPTLSIPTIQDDGSTTPVTSSADFSFPTKIYFDRLGWTTLFSALTNSSTKINFNLPGPIFHVWSRQRQKRSFNLNSTLNSVKFLWENYGKAKNTTANLLESNLDFDSDDDDDNVDLDIDPYMDTIEHPGGERAALLPTIVRTLDAMGLNGRPCLQRAICEIHEDSLKRYGLLGEILILVFSVSKSRFAKTKHLQDLLEAERLGKRNNCFVYTSRCKTSIFKWHRNS